MTTPRFRGGIAEHSNVTAEGPPVYQFKTVISDRGRAGNGCKAWPRWCACVVCLKNREWPSRLHDVAENRRRRRATCAQRVRRRGIAQDRHPRAPHEIDETARQRGMGGELNT